MAQRVEDRVQLSEGMIIADRFQLRRELGQGGMGAVWLAHHTGLDTPCAIKFIHAEAARLPEIRARFEREAKSAAALRSVNVVAIMDYGVWNDVPYIAMEYLDGEDLASRLRRLGRISPHETVSIVTQVARALSKAHAAGLVHRDLKPENIFLVREEEQEIAKVLDFGIAKEQKSMSSNTRTGALLGTPYFMSPEQAQGTKGIDYRSDLWSLAVVAFRCITGQLPFTSEAFGDLLLKIMVNPLPVPSQIANGIPPSFDAWWQRGAARDPAMRFSSAKELADTLAAALGVGSPQSMGVSNVASGASYPQAGPVTQPVLPQGSTTSPGLGASTPGPQYSQGARGPMGHAAGVPGFSPNLTPMGSMVQPAPPTMVTPNTAVAHTFSGQDVPKKKSNIALPIVVLAAMLVGGGTTAFLMLRNHSGPNVATAPHDSAPAPSVAAPPAETASAPSVTAGADVSPPSTSAAATTPSASASVAVKPPHTSGTGTKATTKSTAAPKGDYGF